MGVAPGVELLSGSEDECSRAADVLVLLALDGSDEARDGLRAHVRGGEHWVSVVELVADRWPDAWWEDLADVARKRIGQEPEPPWHVEPWKRFGIAARRPASRPVPPDLSGRTDGELLDLLAKALPDDCVRARLGQGVLADQLVPEALPVLVAELAELRRTRTWCGPAATARRLARFGPAAAPAVGDLRRLWLHTPHSYERAAYLEALAAIDPSGLDYAHSESLWDCQEQAQLLGVAHAQDNPTTLAHIAALRDDPMVSTDLRMAASAHHHRGLGP
ncbi:hypothetical protein G6045_38810 [Streptomyces sp. YC504]|uniref:Uncharacterized protein n=1 Tax=Streptomyces mesophilus TaxID=1775132 RepID=A0A6G4XXN3_9ACTN|nr:hypothetical protein [Streptomyces mesophilus]NGO81567.1 hypothetical protein [Streptomyces mesophilus]